MSVTTPHKRTEIPEEILSRFRRQLLVIATILLAIGAGWLGIVMRPYLGQIVLTIVAVALIWLVIVSAIDFFRDR
jgi:glucose-6-phosphate-specific signal transduction histidine kinase